MIKKLKSFFKPASEFCQFFTKSSILKNNFVLRLEDIDTLTVLFMEQSSIEEFFEILKNDQQFNHYPIRMKLLISMHEILLSPKVCISFADKLNQVKFTMFYNSPRNPQNLIFKQTNSEVWIIENIQLPYLQYLQKQAISIDKLSDYRRVYFTKQLDTDGQQSIVECFQLQNLVNQALSLTVYLKIALTNFPNDFLLKKIAQQIYVDISLYYKQLISLLISILDKPNQLSYIEIYEFFREIQSIEKKAMAFYASNKLYDPGRKLMPPIQLKVDLKSAQQIEFYAQKEKRKINLVQNSSRSQRQSVEKKQIDSNNSDCSTKQGFKSQRNLNRQLSCDFKRINYKSKSSYKKQDTIQEDLEQPTVEDNNIEQNFKQIEENKASENHQASEEELK